MSRRRIAFKMMPDGNIRAYQANKEDKAGVSEWMITRTDNIAPTVIGMPPKIYEVE